MTASWWSRRPCRYVRDQILSRVKDPGASVLPPKALRHMEECPDCREFEEAFGMVDRMGSAWRAPEPPPGLARRTIAFVEPHWRRAHHPVTRQEIRLIWSSGLAVAGSAAAFALVLADRAFPLGEGTQVGDLLRVGLKVAIVQLTGGAVVLVALLANRWARSRGSRPRPEDRPGDGNS